MTYRGSTLLVALLFFGLVATEAPAQSYYQTARSFVQSPQALGMGDAGAAFSSRQGVFFQNPAHLSEAVGVIPRINIVGAQGSLSTSVFDQYTFYRDRVSPKIEEGIQNLPPEEQYQLYSEALAHGQRRAYLNGDVLLPSVMLRTGPVGIGAGAFVHSNAMYHLEDSGNGVPLMNFSSRADLMAVGSAALDLSYFGLPGLSGGLSLKYTKRYLTFKEKPLDEIVQRERVMLYAGNSLGVDLGALYEVPVTLPGSLRLGAAAYDVLATDFNYRHDRTLSEYEPSPETLEAETQLARERFGLSPSYRIGAAYTVPSLGGLLGETGLAVDYLGYSSPRFEPSFLSSLHIGAQAKVAGMLRARAGLSQGYPTLGAGIGLGFIQIDYAFYGVDEGLSAGHSGGWHHLLQLRVGL